MKEDSEQTGRASALAIRHLSRRPRSEAEVRARLRREYPAEIVDKVIQDLREQALIDDRAFARLWADGRLRNKPRSAWLVKRELLGKGVPAEIAADAVSEFDDADSAYRAAAAYARRLANADYQAFHRRLGGYLARRGFSESTARRTAAQLWRNRDAEHDADPGAEA